MTPSRTRRGATETAVTEMLGRPMARLSLTEAEWFIRNLAAAPCRRERIAEVWPYHFRMSGAVVVFMDGGNTVECVVRMDDWRGGHTPIARSDSWPPNKALQLTKPAQAMELCS